MSDFLSLTCPSCGSKLKITDDIDRFACRSCGNEFIVNRGEGIVTLKPLVEGLGKIQKGVDKTASELAIRRLQDEIVGLQKSFDILRDKRNTSEMPNITLIGGLFMVSVFSLCFFTIMDSQIGLRIILFLGFIGTLITGIILIKRGQQQKEVTIKSINNRLIDIKNAMDEKKREIEIHRDIVKK